MSYEDVSQATPEATTLARADVDSLPAGSTGPASGNAITGAGTITGQAGADSVGDPPGHIVEVHGAGGDSSGSNGEFVVKGAYGTLTIEADGSYTYVRNAGAPDGVDDVFNYTLADKDGHQSSTTLTIELGVQTPAEAVSAALAGVPGVISLPAGVDVSDIHVVGRDLVIDLPDGTHMTIPGGAVFVPQLVIGDVEIPPSNLAALLIDSEPKPAAGPPQSSGGNFAVDVPPLDPGVPLGDLLPPTELVFQPPEFQPVNQFEDREPTVLIETPDNPAGAVNAAESVSEKGLASRGGEPAGSGEIADGNSLNNSDTSETNSGTIVYTAEDGLQSITVNGTAITGVGQVIHGQFGTMTITSIADGAIGYSYTLLDNTSGDNTADNFSVVVTDSDGDTATGTLTVHIADDVPTAHIDADSLTGSDTSTDGNVMTGAGTDSGSSGADVTGADNATVTGAHAGTTGSFTSVPQDGSSVVIHGAFGDLELHEDGSYTYTRTDAHAGGTDTFTYQLTDGDGDTSSATLTISVPQINQAPEVRAADVNVSEEGLVGGNQDSTGNPDTTNLASNGGTLFINDPDGDATTATLGIPSGSFTSGGTPVVWAVSDGGHTLTGTAGGDTVITITIDDSGHFNVALSGAFDDPAANVEDSIGFDVPVQVSDGLATVSTSINVTVEDDSPVVSNVATGAGVTLDETAAGSLAGYPISATSATAAITATTASGADTPASTAYGLSITGQPANLATAIGDHAITLVQIDADTIEGQYTDGSGTHTAFSIDIGSDGKLTVTQDVPLEHLVDGSSASAYNDALDLTGLVNATITVTDADGDTASGSAAIGGNITFLDDGPSIDVAAGADSGIVLETQDAQTAGAASDTATSTANFGGVFTIASSSGGGDGTASISPLAYTLGAADGSDSGLTQTGNTIYLYQLADGSVVGSTAGSEGAVTSGNTVFSVTVDGSGQVTLTQFSQIDHPIADDPSATGAPFADQTITLADGAITLTASATITDNDGDTASDSQTIGIGSNIIFDDDGPSVTGVTAGAGVTLDETAAGSLAGYPISATSATAAITATTASGADTPASTAYGLSITGQPANLATAIGDHAITLVQIDADTIEGQYTDGSGTHTAFSIDIGSDGKLTVTQDVPLEHLVDGSSASAYNDALDLTGLVNATITVTDADGDTASGSAAIGGNITFLDDGPSIDVAAGADSGIVLETQDAQTAGAASDTATSTANFGGVFTIASSSGGGDGTASISPLAYTLGAADGSDSGLTQTGNTIYLYQLADGSVVGSTAGSEGAVTSGNTVFSVTVDGSGQVTLTQFSQIDHPIADDPSATGAPFADQTITLADGAITLTASATITDNDGDTASDSQTIGIGSNIIFDDDGPSVTGVTAGAGVTLDETAAGSLAGYPISATSATAAITATTASGADTPASTAYGLSITGQPANLATAIGDHAITLVQIDADTIEGQYTDGSGTHTAFSIDIGSDGKLTVTQDVPLEHLVDGSSASAYNDALDLTGLVNATITVTDADGDTASGSAAIGGNITFLDDGPSIDVAAGADSGIVLETQDAQTAGAASDTATSTANFGGVFTIASSSGGGDGTASISPLAYTLGAADGSDSGLTQTGNTIYLYQLADGSVVGSTAGSEGAVTSGNTVFSVTVDGSGQVTLTQFSQIDHPIADDPSATGAPFADQTITLADGAITLTASATITDNDGDTASDSQTIGIGSNIIFDDDGPSVTGVTAGAGVTLDETAAGSLAGYPISATSATAAITATTASGADTPASTAYGLSITGQPANLATAIGDHAITLVQIDADTIEGQYTDGSGTHTAFSIDIGSDGKLTVTQDVPLEHLVDGSSASAYNDALDLTGLVNATITVTDADGDTASGSAAIGGNITFLDDGPSIDVAAGADSGIVLETQDAQTAGAASDTATSTANFGGVFTIASSSGGGDGTASVSPLAYTLGAADGSDSGLTQTGNTIYLYQLADGSVVGSTAGSEGAVTSGNTVFSVTVDGSGQVTLTQFSQIDHPIADDPSATGAPFADQTITLADGAITLTASATITDNDGDTASDSQTIGIGSNIIFDDDGPSVTGVTAGAGVTLDETAAGSLAGYPISATSATAAITATTASGADTPASTAYGLSITGQPANLATAIGDHAITLVQIDADTIEGQYTDGSGTHTAFSIDIGSDGKLTVTQDVPLEHLVDGSSASAYNDALDLTGLVNATITVTDADGDTASGSAAIGGNITFLDDGPSIDVAAGADSGIVLETQDAQTAGAASDTATSTANFGGVFTIASSSGGGDGTASVSPLAYTLGAADGSDSGLTQTGNTIYLYQLADGSVVGSTAGSEGAVTSGNTVFSVTVDGSGQVTLTQFSQIDHPIADDPSATGAPFADQTITLADGAITLTASATITDNDGDTASDSQTIGIGSNIIFDDDGPSVSNVTGGSSITFDETSAGDITGWPAASVTSAAAMISATVATGADTPASTVYGLELAGGVNSLASGLQTAQGDHAITLVQIDADTIEGQYQDGGTQTAFTIQMNSNGTVTYTQDVPLEHSDDGNTAIAYNDTNSPITFDGLVLGTITVTDYDGDTATGSTNIGDQISIFDDGPTAVAPEAIVTTDEIQPMITASLDLGDHNVVDNFGADGPGTITFANITDGQGTGLTSGGDAITLWLSSDGQTIEGRTNSTDGTDGSLIYTVHIDQANSNYEFTMSGTIDNGSGIVLSDFSSAPAGQNKWIGLDSDGGDIAADNNNSPDLLLTGINGGTVNTSSADIGSNNQWIDNGEGIRIDFVTDVNRNGASTEKTAQGYTFDGHYDVTGTSFSIIQEQGSGAGAAVRIAAYEDSDTGTLQTLSGSPVAIDQSSIVVTGDTTYTIIDMGDGTFVITGLAAGANVSFDTGGADYDAISITNATGQANPNGGTFSGQSFAVGAFGYFTAAAGDPVHLNYDLQVTDSDGDFTTVLGGVDITLNPAGSGTATTTATTLSTFSADATTLSASTLLATNDNSGGQKAGGQQTYSNNAVLFGAVAAAGLMSEQAAASDTSHATGHDLGAANETLVSSDSVSQLQLASNDDNNVQSISGETKVAVSDTQQPQDSSHQAADTQPLNLDNSDHGSANAPTDLPQGTDMPAHADSAAAQTVAAATVAMPSAEQIAAAATTAGANGVSGDGHSQVDNSSQHNQVVGKVLADSLAGGSGHESAIDAILNNLPSHDGAHAVMDALASHGAASVPAWDVGGLGAFAAAHPVFTMEPMMLHPDAAPAAHS